MLSTNRIITPLQLARNQIIYALRAGLLMKQWAQQKSPASSSEGEVAGLRVSEPEPNRSRLRRLIEYLKVSDLLQSWAHVFPDCTSKSNLHPRL